MLYYKFAKIPNLTSNLTRSLVEWKECEMAFTLASFIYTPPQYSRVHDFQQEQLLIQVDNSTAGTTVASWSWGIQKRSNQYCTAEGYLYSIIEKECV